MEISINVASLLLSVMIIVSEDAVATVTMTQSNSEVIVGGTTRMSCVTSLPKEIYWRHFPAGGPAHEDKEVYAYGKMHSPYKGRCEMQINRITGFYELFIPRVELTDAGVYTCQEDEGIGDSAQAQLTVLEAGPTCTSTKNPIELIGPNSCNKEQENLMLKCSVAYRGNIQPLLEWKMVGFNDTVTQGLHLEKTQNLITYHLTMSSKPTLDGSSYICQTTKTRNNCTSDAIKIIYVISSNFTQKAMIGDTVVCTANTNESCSYRWKWFKGDDVLTASNDRTLIPKQSGNFRCEAECFIRKEPCTITAMFAYVVEDNVTSATGGTSDLSLLWLLVSLIIPLGVFAAVVVYYVWKKNRGAQRAQSQNAKDQTELLPAKQGQSAPSQYAQEDEIDSGDAIRKAFNEAPLLRHGLSGEILGPMRYKDIQCGCLFERIVFTKDQRIKTETGKLSEEKTICDNGRKWMALNHNNLIKVFDVVLQSQAVYIVMEHATGESVREALEKRTEDLPIEMVMDWATQIAQGLGYLHESGIVHKNVDSSQIFIVESTDVEATLKIACFNFYCKDSLHTSSSVIKNIAISPPDDKYTEKYDVWSFGIVIWEMLTRTKPYKGVIRQKIVNDIYNGAKELKIPDSCPEELQEILNGCRRVEPSERPSFSDILLRLKKCEIQLLEVGTIGGRPVHDQLDIRRKELPTQSSGCPHSSHL